MLEPPAIANETIISALQSEYGLRDVSLAFLPLGADLGSAVYRATTAGGSAYFAKLRLGPLDELPALVPYWLAQEGIAEVMAPLAASSGHPWAAMGELTLLLYPFVEGQDAYKAFLSDGQWLAFGKTLRAIHAAEAPPALADRLPRETYSPRWRDELHSFMAQLDGPTPVDAVAVRLAAFLRERRAQVIDLIERTAGLAEVLHAERAHPVLCHTDLHPGNLLVCEDGRFFIVDWDAPMLARRERDLMYPGGGLGFVGRSPEEEEALFYAGYGAVQVDAQALAYYRFERIVEDLAIFCGQLLAPTEGAGDRNAAPGAGADREQALRWAMSNFEPGGVLEVAYRTECKDATFGV